MTEIQTGKEIRLLFQYLDKNQDGYITNDELRNTLLETCSINSSRREINYMVKVSDYDEDGKLSLQDFAYFYLRCMGLNPEDLKKSDESLWRLQCEVDERIRQKELKKIQDEEDKKKAEIERKEREEREKEEKRKEEIKLKKEQEERAKREIELEKLKKIEDEKRKRDEEFEKIKKEKEEQERLKKEREEALEKERIRVAEEKKRLDQEIKRQEEEKKKAEQEKLRKEEEKKKAELEKIKKDEEKKKQESLKTENPIDSKNSTVIGASWNCMMIGKECKFVFYPKNASGEIINQAKDIQFQISIPGDEDDDEAGVLMNLNPSSFIEKGNAIEFKFSPSEKFTHTWYNFAIIQGEKIILQNMNVLVSTERRIKTEIDKLKKKIQQLHLKQSDSGAMGYETSLGGQILKLEQKKDSYQMYLDTLE